MANTVKIRLPFAWITRFWLPIALAATTIVAGFFRFYQIASLPPGLDEASARIGLQALNLGHTHWLPTLDSTNGYAPLWVWLQALTVQLFDHTALALRILPALIGTLAVIATWLWIRDWFGKRTAWIVAFLMAISPWAVTISRNGTEFALLLLLVPLTLWASSRALRKPDMCRFALLGTMLALDLLSGPIGWVLAVCVLGLGIGKLAKARSLFAFTKARAVGAGLLAIGAGLLSFLVATSLPAIKILPQSLSFPDSLSELGQNVIKILSMFNVHGDENYQHNLTGEPLLNAFIGIMMITGLLVCISRLHQRLYRVFLGLLGALLLPAVLSTAGVPNSNWAAGALPLILALAGLGTSYMLELWYTTFPINSAARTTGQAAIVLLLALSALQSYTQYFKAWAGSAAVYAAYNEGATAIAKHVATTKFKGERYVVLPAEQIPVVHYLAHSQTNYQAIPVSKLEGIPVATTNRLLYITAASRNDAVKILKAKFPGGVLRPHYSSFNLVEIYYTYEVTK